MVYLEKKNAQRKFKVTHVTLFYASSSGRGWG